MAKKKKIREEFQKVFEAGNDRKIKKMLEQHSWLLDEMSHEMDASMTEQHQIAAAIGVMEDEYRQPVSADQIVYCLKEDFKINKSEIEISPILDELENLNLTRKNGNGWILTEEGGNACDEYINSYRKKM